MDPIEYFSNDLKSGKVLCLLPLSRCLVERPTELCKGVILYPPGYFSPDYLNIVDWPERGIEEILQKIPPEDSSGSSTICNNLPWAASYSTGITREEFLSSALICLSGDLDWPAFFNPESHENHLDLIRKFSEEADETLDMIRLRYCRLDLTDTLPGKPGFLGIGPYSCAQFYNSNHQESYIVAGKILSHTVIGGIGLDMSNVVSDVNLGNGELGSIARQGLRMFSQALEANSLTNKFIQSIFLIEYLADPDKYLKMEKVKKNIAIHVACDRSQYDQILEYFMYLTSQEVNDKKTGLRTQIVHHGKRIEDIVQSKEEINKILLKVQRYISIVLWDFIKNSHHDWQHMEQFRRNKAKNLGLIKSI